MKARRFLSFAGAALLASFALARPAAAAPSNADLDDMFSHVGVELRGTSVLTPSLDRSVASGGDFHLVIEGSRFGLLLGARLLATSGRNSIAAFDTSFRAFLDPSSSAGFYGALGFFYGSEYVDAFAFGDVGAAFLEGGVELLRHSPFRPVIALRLDLGYAAPSAASRVSPTATFTSAGLALGFVFGGPDTEARRRPRPPSPSPDE